MKRVAWAVSAIVAVGCQHEDPSSPEPDPPGVVQRVLRVPSAYPTVQSAIDEAMSGDTILVASGTYGGAANRGIDFGGIDLVLRSEAGSDSTFLECAGSGRAFYLHSGESRESVIEGFTIRNGAAENPHDAGGDSGGGARFDNCAPTLRDCRFEQCRARFGGAIFAEVASPRLESCVFRGNSATELDGGALYLSNGDAELDGCEIAGNQARRGGGIYCDRANPHISQSTVAGNFADDTGGGIYVRRLSTLSCDRTIVSANGSGASGADATVLSGTTLSIECCALDSSRVAATGSLTIGKGLILADPGFCEAVSPESAPTLEGSYRLVEVSLCRPSGNECEVLIGATDTECAQ
jgi:predicted outer membrane repeat protein